jgi:hypothetical protein
MAAKIASRTGVSSESSSFVSQPYAAHAHQIAASTSWPCAIPRAVGSSAISAVT